MLRQDWLFIKNVEKCHLLSPCVHLIDRMFLTVYLLLGCEDDRRSSLDKNRSGILPVACRQLLEVINNKGECIIMDLSAITNLRKHFKREFKEIPEEYKYLAQQMQTKILSCGRSVKDQLIETQVLVDEHKTKNFLGEISLALSALAIVFTILSFSSISSAISIYFPIILAFIALVLVYYSLRVERYRAKSLSYYLFKLRCLKELSESHDDSTHNPSSNSEVSQQDD